MTMSPQRQAELFELLWAQSEGSLAPQQLLRLQSLLSDDRECRRMYVRYMHLWSSLYWDLAPHDQPIGELAHITQSAPPRINKPLTDVGCQPVPSHIGTPCQPVADGAPYAAPRSGAGPLRVRQWAAAWYSGVQRPQVFSVLMAALVVVGVLAILGILRISDRSPMASAPAAPAAPQQLVAWLTDTDGCVWDSDAPPAGRNARLLSGQMLRLARGEAHLTFINGAQVQLTGPAVLQLQADDTSMLELGRIYAVVPESARGFRVNTPGASVVDLGTRFGVAVDAAQGAEIHVFLGKVNVYADEDPQHPITLGRNEALQVSAQGVLVRRLPARPEEFAAGLVDRHPIPIVSTGAGLQVGQRDPHWRITAASTLADFRPQQAVVMAPHEKYRPPRPPQSQWISLTRQPGSAATNCEFTFRTTFSLEGFDPATARIRGHFAVDNVLVGWRLNGRDLPPPVPPGRMDELSPLDISTGFVAGENVLELVVLNTGERPNPMGLLAELRGTAQRLSPRDAEEHAQHP